jgi:long-chain fatty acid transport protein
MSRAETGVAKPCADGSALFYNPAAIGHGDGLTLSAGLTVVAAAGEFTDDRTGNETELDNDPIPVPHLYGTYPVTPDLAVGLGVYVPYGLETKWPNDWDGSFEGYDNGLEAFYIQPTVAYQVTDRIRVGGGPIVGISSVELNQRIDLSQQQVPNALAAPAGLPEGTSFSALGVPFHTAFADSKLEASGATAFGGHIGVTVDVTDRLRFGTRYMLPMTFEYEGDATFSPVSTGLTLPAAIANPQTGDVVLPAGTPVDQLVRGQFTGDGALADQTVETEIGLPAQFVAGLAFDATARLTLLADYQWTGWSSFDEIVLSFDRLPDSVREENYDNTSAVRLGAEYVVSEAFTVRTGYLFNQAAAPDETVTPLLPENDRNHLTLGVGWQPTDLLEVNVAYQYLNQNDRRGRTRDLRDGETAADANSGLYAFGANLFGATLTLHL